jgi:arylformamidase
MLRRFFSFLLIAALILGLAQTAQAGRLRDMLRARAAGGGTEAPDDAEEGGSAGCAELNARVERLMSFTGGKYHGPRAAVQDVAYGAKAREKLDVFYSRNDDNGLAPVIVMVHGGAWCIGDKAARKVTANKTARWVPRGFVFVSVNYPMLPDGSTAPDQAEDVARAVAYVQSHAREWGGDPARIILMGHSAGAHLVSLVNASADIKRRNGVKPVLGAVSLDSGATNVPVQMSHAVNSLKGVYGEAFGTEEAGWIRASPWHQVDKTSAPWLGVCSTLRKDGSCDQAESYAEKSRSLGVRAEVLPEDKKHDEINDDLGMAGDYTDAVETFMASLDPAVAKLLGR